jgi:NtrC-family two-component system sensor histidine kinase KinB
MAMRLAGALRGPTFRALLKSYLLGGLVLIAAGIALFAVRVTGEVDLQARLTTRLIARIAAESIFAETPDAQKLAPLAEAIEDVAFPFVFTDVQGRPVFWNSQQVHVPFPESYEHLRAQPGSPEHAAMERVRALVARFDAAREPIPVRGPGDQTVLGYLHYGESSLSRRMLWMPWLEAALILVFMGVALLAFRNMKRSEQRSIWVGMAKETAHQMGTPLTSLNGWLALLADEEAMAARGPGAFGRDEVLHELQNDAERLAKVSARFSQIGSRPKLKLGRVDELISQVCAYFRRRLPHLGKKVRFVEKIEEVPLAPISAELLDWALENLIKNALDASDKTEGVVEVVCHYLTASDWIEILITDNGKGMSPAVQRRVFEPGFSTKQSGWGMGLVLVHRIVVEYHGGHVGVARSVPEVGTSMRVLLRTR